MLLTLFRSYTLYGLIPSLCFASITAIMRYDPDGRKNFSALTTFLVGLFLPVAVSAEPQKAQYLQKEEVDNEKNTTENRMSISGRVSLFTSPVILLFDLVLFLFLLFIKGFRVNCGLILGVDDTKEVAIKVLYSFLLPSGMAAIMAAYILSKRSTRKTVLLVLGILSATVLSLSIFTPIYILEGKSCVLDN